jgi:hypothetical protein
VYYLYGSKQGAIRRLAATFDSAEQLRSYANWATLKRNPDGTSKFEQGSALSGFEFWQESLLPQTADNPEQVIHNPSPSML